MATPIKVLVHLDSQTEPEVGGSEVYWLADGNVDTLIDSIPATPGGASPIVNPDTRVATLIAARLAPLSPSWSVTAVEVIEDGGGRQGRYTQVDVAQWKGAYPGRAFLPERQPIESFASLLLQKISVAGGKRYISQSWLMGCPEEIIDDATSNQLNRNNPTFFGPAGALAVFVTTLTARAYCNRTKKQIAPNAYADLSAYQVTADGRFACATPLLPNMAAGNIGFVNLKGIKAPRGHNGTHRFVVPNVVAPAGGFPAGTYFQVGPFRRTKVSLPLWTTSPSGSGTVLTESVGVQQTQYTYVPFTNVLPLRVSEHKRGRPFKLPAGRRS